MFEDGVHVCDVYHFVLALFTLLDSSHDCNAITDSETDGKVIASVLIQSIKYEWSIFCCTDHFEHSEMQKKHYSRLVYCKPLANYNTCTGMNDLSLIYPLVMKSVTQKTCLRGSSFKIQCRTNPTDTA